MRLKIRHNMEVAHRLSLTEGNCQRIHGHGMQIELVLLDLYQELTTGMAMNSDREVLDFSELKRRFRKYIDEGYDHHLLLNEGDPWARPLGAAGEENCYYLPGLKTFPGDPTVENLAKWIALWSADAFKVNIICRIEETKTNGAEVMAIYGNKEATIR